MKQVVYESLRESEFEVNWFKMVHEFELQENAWLQSLYHCRHMLIHVYLKRHFWAGMSTTQRSENMNAFFDGYVHSKTSLKVFVKEYDNDLRFKVEKESQADFVSYSRSLSLVSDLHIEKQFWEVCTHKIFKKFQVELKGLMHCNATLLSVDGRTSYYNVLDSILRKDGNFRKEINLLVEMNEPEETIVCLCSLFLFKGIVCRHVVAAMILHRMNNIPEKYILPRWRKDVKRRHSMIKSSYDDSKRNPQKQRYDAMCKLSYGAAEVASLTTELSNLWTDYIVEGKDKILGVVTSVLGKASCKSSKLVSPTKRRRNES